MTTRRTHTKTRRGCYNCKKRHIKCDQLGPPCANCEVRGIECSQIAPTDVRRTAPASAPGPATFSAFVPPLTPLDTNCPVIAFRSDESRILEIELIHKWSTSTYRDFSILVNDGEFWQMTVVQDATNHDFLLEAVLAISSLHVAISTAPERSGLYHTAALQYQNRAIIDFKAKALPVKASNHQALFAFSLIVLALAFALPRYSPHDPADRSICAHLRTVFSLLQGTTSIFRSSRAWLHTGPFAEIVGKYQNKELSSITIEDDTGKAFSHLRALNDAEYVSMLTSKSSSVVSDLVIWHETNLKAISWLQQCFRSDPGEVTLRCLTWLATLEPAFMRQIEVAEPFALLVTMHWAILLHQCGESRWWASSSGKILITELGVALGSRTAVWGSAIAWVYRQVGLPVVA